MLISSTFAFTLKTLKTTTYAQTLDNFSPSMSFQKQPNLVSRNLSCKNAMAEAVPFISVHGPGQIPATLRLMLPICCLGEHNFHRLAVDGVADEQLAFRQTCDRGT